MMMKQPAESTERTMVTQHTISFKGKFDISGGIRYLNEKSADSIKCKVKWAAK